MTSMSDNSVQLLLHDHELSKQLGTQIHRSTSTKGSHLPYHIL